MVARRDSQTVIVADDSAVVREGVTRILTGGGFDVIGQARSAEELLDLVAREQPALVVVDIRMPPSQNAGLLAAERIRERYRNQVRVLVLSQYLEPDYALRLLGAGVDGIGYLLKDRIADASELVDGARRVAEGGSAIDPDVVAELVRNVRGAARLARLAPRERAVLAAMAEGRSNRSIAGRLHLSVKTVESLTAAIFDKLDLQPGPDDNRRVLAVLAYLDARD
ncbi:MAG: response regulator transcription factor [Geodermatophilaceae bacterium]|nr:response regulator transcription factor [Geodermatophilaceae bacterium]